MCVDALLLRRVGRAAGRRRRAAARGGLRAARRAHLDAERLHRLGVEVPGGLHALRFLEVNAAAIAHYGYSRDEFLAKRITDIRPEEDVPANMKEYIQINREVFKSPNPPGRPNR